MFYINDETLKELQEFVNNPARDFEDLSGEAQTYLCMIIDIAEIENDKPLTENSEEVINAIKNYQQLA